MPIDFAVPPDVTDLDIEAARALIYRCAWQLDHVSTGPDAAPSSSVTKVDARAFRVYDGPSETHRWAVARRAIRNHRETS